MQKQSISMSIIHLHSTMFLLIRQKLSVQKFLDSLFTFHNVSINTNWGLLHILRHHQFTFHNVSINTGIPFILRRLLLIFTFHNVSINTAASLFSISALCNLHSTMFLLILSCICQGFQHFLHLHSTMFLLIRVCVWSCLPSFLIYIPQCFY